MRSDLSDHSDETSSDQDFPEQLARRPARRSSWGSFIPVLGMAVCAYLLAQAKDDLAYLFASSTPVDLGRPGAYHLERAQPGSYAELAGEVHSEGSRFEEAHASGRVWPMQSAPILVARHDDKELRGKVQVRGMLRVDDQLPGPYHKVIATFLGMDQLGLPPPGGHVWLLVDGRAPRGFDRTNAWLAVLMLLFGINTWLLLRPMFRR